LGPIEHLVLNVRRAGQWRQIQEKAQDYSGFGLRRFHDEHPSRGSQNRRRQWLLNTGLFLLLRDGSPLTAAPGRPFHGVTG
jgi:hypothetical protein